MALFNFDDLKKNLENAGNEIAKKTKDTAETVKLSSQISSAQSKIREQYQIIGEKYYNAIAECPTADYAAEVELIKSLSEEIKSLKEQLDDIKGVVTCAECGAKVTRGASFCNNCGAKIIYPEPESVMGEAVDEDAEDIDPDAVEDKPEE